MSGVSALDDARHGINTEEHTPLLSGTPGDHLTLDKLGLQSSQTPSLTVPENSRPCVTSLGVADSRLCYQATERRSGE